MTTYVLFDKKTGEIVQTHVQTDTSRGRPEDIVRMAKPEAREALDVLAVDQLTPGASYKVDIKARKLVQVDHSKVRGFGGASVQRAGGDPGAARRLFFDPKEKESPKR